jgi:hypothetical protein
MTLIVEDGTAVAGAESYATVAAADAYWDARPHSARSATWSAVDDAADKEGALREASAYLDATYGPYYRGVRQGHVQGLMWPRTGALDDAGYPMPELPSEIVAAAIELAVRAIGGPLAEDADRGARVKRERRKVDVVETETEYEAGAPVVERYGRIDGLLAPILNGQQPGAPSAKWIMG